MDQDFKLLLCLLAFFVAAPLIGLGISDWRKQDCRVELSKAGKSLDEINAICK